MKKIIIESAIKLTKERHSCTSEQLLVKLFTNGSVVTTDTPIVILGGSGVTNFIDYKVYDGGVDLYEWTLRDEFWRSKLLIEYLEPMLDDHERGMEELEQKLAQKLSDFNDINSYISAVVEQSA